MITDKDIETIAYTLNSINTLTIYIEPYYDGQYSIVAEDEEGETWIEIFADNYQQAHEMAHKLARKITAEY